MKVSRISIHPFRTIPPTQTEDACDDILQLIDRVINHSHVSSGKNLGESPRIPDSTPVMWYETNYNLNAPNVFDESTRWDEKSKRNSISHFSNKVLVSNRSLESKSSYWFRKWDNKSVAVIDDGDDLNEWKMNHESKVARKIPKRCFVNEYSNKNCREEEILATQRKYFH